MPCLNVTGIVVRNPDFTVRVFRRTAALQLVNQANVVPRTEYIHGDAQQDQARAEPERGSVRARLKTLLAALQRLQEQTEASHHKPKAHQRQTCSDPSEEGSFCSKVVRWAAGRSVCHLLTISGCLQDRKRSPSFCPGPGSGRWLHQVRVPTQTLPADKGRSWAIRTTAWTPLRR